MTSTAPRRKTQRLLGRWNRRLTILLVSLTSWAMLAGCGGAEPPGGDPPLTRLLSDIPANWMTRTSIAINNLRILEVAVDLPTGAGAQLLTDMRNAPQLGRLAHEILIGTPLGSGTLVGGFPSGELGYGPGTIQGELSVGNPPYSLSVVDGVFDRAAVGRALTRNGWSERIVGSTPVYVGEAKPDSPGLAALSDLHQIAVSDSRLVAAGPAVPPTELADVLEQHTATRSLADDPAVSETMRLLAPSDSVAVGSTLVGSPGRVHISAGLPCALFAGYAVTRRGTWKAVTLYPSRAAAAQAKDLISHILRYGVSQATGEAYMRLVHVTSITAAGDAVLVTLSASSLVPRMIASADFPPFFAAQSIS